jgi:hypothetical protein
MAMRIPFIRMPGVLHKTAFIKKKNQIEPQSFGKILFMQHQFIVT